MPGRNYTIEELMLDDSFLNYCLEKKDADRAFWEREMEYDFAQKTIILEAKYTICLLHGKLDPEEVNRQVDVIKQLVEDHQKHAFRSEKVPFPYHKKTINKDLRKSASKKTKSFLLYSSMIATAIVFALYFFANPLSKKADINAQKTTLYKTGMGQRLNVQLPDGSVAILNSNSQMIIGKDFNQTARSVLLNGEAYFQVAKNEQKEFTVKSGKFSATALGTSFYIHGQSSESAYKVDLLEGRLVLKSTKNQQLAESILNAGQEGYWDMSNKTFSKSFSNQSLLKEWIKGKLSFTGMAAGDVFNLLSQWYGVVIQAKHPRWATIRLTGVYDRQTLDEVLKIICFSLSTSYSYKDNGVIIE